jgi:hypothetical protein
LTEKYAKLLITDTTRNWNGSACWFAADRITPLTDPTSADNVHMDALTFLAAGQSLVVNSVANCLNMDWTGATNTPTLNHGSFDLITYGSVTFIAGMIHTGVNRLRFLSSTNITFTTGGVLSFDLQFYLNPASSVTFQDNVNNGSQQLRLQRGIIITNNKTITCGQVLMDGVEGTIVTLGSSVINATSWSYTGSSYTLTANTSTINVSGTGAFAGGNITTYNNINLNGTAHTVSGNFTCNTLATPPATTQTITFTAGTAITVADATLSGSAGHVHTLTSTGSWFITKTGGGTISTNYATIRYSQARPVKTFYARPPSTNGGGNTGWRFPNSNDNNVLEQMLMAELL